jgi:uncharacterized membrane protein YkvA (DUF1232 family)
MSDFKKQLAAYFKAMAGRKYAGRGLTVYPDDTFLVSFPRSGNTWTRFLVCNLMDPDHPVTFAELESRIPEIYDVPDRILRRFPRPRTIKSHESFDPRYRKVIYIVRDPRDVAVSYYEFQLKRKVISEQCTLESFLPRFLESEFEPTTGCWGDHVLSWLATRHGRSNFLMLRYEDMQQQTAEAGAHIARFLGVDSAPERVARAVELSSADRMRALEREQAHLWKETRRTRQDKPFVRRAVAGGWKWSLPESCVFQIESAWGHIMQMLGYALTTRAHPQPLPNAWSGVLVGNRASQIS